MIYNLFGKLLPIVMVAAIQVRRAGLLPCRSICLSLIRDDLKPCNTIIRLARSCAKATLSVRTLLDMIDISIHPINCHIQ